MPHIHHMPHIPHMCHMSHMPHMSHIPYMPHMQVMSDIPPMLHVPHMPDIPHLPHMPHMLHIQHLPPHWSRMHLVHFLQIAHLCSGSPTLQPAGGKSISPPIAALGHTARKNLVHALRNWTSLRHLTNLVVHFPCNGRSRLALRLLSSSLVNVRRSSKTTTC